MKNATTTKETTMSASRTQAFFDRLPAVFYTKEQTDLDNPPVYVVPAAGVAGKAFALRAWEFSALVGFVREGYLASTLVADDTKSGETVWEFAKAKPFDK